jgi:alkylated DNA repair dioxygenase AlkB
MAKRILSECEFEEPIFKKFKPNRESSVILDESGCKVIYIKNFLTQQQIKDLEKLMTFTEFKEEKLKMFGREIVAPRKVTSYGTPGLEYRYARKTEKCLPWTKELEELRDYVWQGCQEFQSSNEPKTPFNFVLLNKYKDGADYMGAHSDNEPDIVPDSCIASLSIGQPRPFRFIKKGTKLSTSVNLESGSLLLMLGKTQSLYKHELPKRTAKMRERYNLTFRHLNKN